MSKSRQEKDQRISDLIKLNDELENYFRNTIIPQLFVDAELILRKFTPPAMKHFDLSADDVGRPFVELSDNIKYTVIIDDINHVIQSGEILEKEVQTADSRWFQMNILPYIVQKDNRPNGVIITFVDITERITTLNELEWLNASHETFIYSVVHDLKAPLANIEGLLAYLKTLSTSPEDYQERTRISQLLEKSVRSMRNIIDELAELPKLENRERVEKETVAIADIIDDVKLILNDKIQSSGAQIYLDIQEPKVKFSRKNLRSTIYNLLSNAIKYRSSERSPAIHFKSWLEDGHTFLSVKDNGRGIASEEMGKLFQPYSRLENKVEGTGIGLY